MLYIIGLGLKADDLTTAGKKAIKNCNKIYLENYTSPRTFDITVITDKNVQDLTRKQVEEEKFFLKEAKNKDIALLVFGDPLCATTHAEIILEAKKENVPVKIIHNISIINAVAETGLQIYKFGKTASIPLDNKNIETPVKILKENQSINAHTLFLLDIKREEYMTVKKGMEYLLRKKAITKDTKCIGCARIGSSERKIRYEKAEELLQEDFGAAPHCLIIPGKLHFIEEEMLNSFK